MKRACKSENLSECKKRPRVSEEKCSVVGQHRCGLACNGRSLHQDAHTNSASKVEVIDKAHTVVAKAAVQEFQRNKLSTRGLDKNESHMYTWVNALGMASWSSDRIGYQHADEAGNEYTSPQYLDGSCRKASATVVTSNLF